MDNPTTTYLPMDAINPDSEIYSNSINSDDMTQMPASPPPQNDETLINRNGRMNPPPNNMEPPPPSQQPQQTDETYNEQIIQQMKAFNFVIIIIKNLLNEFINLESLTLFTNIIMNDMDNLNSIKIIKTTSGNFIKSKFDEINKMRENNNIESESDGIKSTEIDNSEKAQYINMIRIVTYYTNSIKDLKSDIDPSKYTNDKLFEQKITSIKNYDIINKALKTLSETIEIKQENVEISEPTVVNTIKNLINIDTINKIINNIPSNNMKIIFDMENPIATNIFTKLYIISQTSYIYFRLYPLILYLLFVEGIYGVQDVIIRITMLTQIQKQIRSILNTLKNKLIIVKMEGIIVNVSAINIVPKNIIQLIDDFLNNTIVPNNIISLFKVTNITQLFEKTNKEYFTQNDNLVQKQDNNKKYFIFCIIILLAILFVKVFIKH